MENILLDSTKKLQIKLDANKTTNECDITVSYVDTTGTSLADGAQESRSNGASYQDILSAPALSGTMRNALTVTVVNNDTVQHTFYIYKANPVPTPTNYYLVTEQTLAAGASWDSNLNNNIFDWGAAINNAAAAIQVSNASKIGIWDALTGALRSVTMNNLVIYLDTFFMSLVQPGANGNVLTSNGSVWTSSAPSGGGGGDFAVADGRLTLTSGIPVTTSDVTGATTIYYTPYKGTKIGLFDGSSTWNILTFAETSLPLGTLTSGLTYDLFAYNNSGTLALELLAWTNTTTRATALVYQNGILVKSGATTRRYLGTFYTTSTTTTEDSAAKRFVWNYYNRVLRYAYIADTTDSHSYTVTAWRIWNNNIANKIQFVVGVQEDALSNYIYATTSGAVSQWAGTALNSTTFGVGNGTQIASQSAGANLALQAFFIASPATISLGYNYIAAIEYGIAGGTSVNFYMWATLLG